MFRTCLAAAAALLLAACSKAPEDVTARYAVGAGKETLTVQASANGDARVDSGQQSLLRRGGTEYLLMSDSQGSFAVTIPDFVAVMGEMMRESGMKPMGLGPQPEYELVQQGSETVAGLQGKVWKVRPKQTPSLTSTDAAISDDPTLAGAGKALTMQTRLGMASMEQVQGGQGNLEKRVEEMLGKGLVLRFGNALRLSSLERKPIEPDAFALPKTVLGKAQLKARLVAERARAAAAPKAVPPALPK